MRFGGPSGGIGHTGLICDPTQAPNAFLHGSWASIGAIGHATIGGAAHSPLVRVELRQAARRRPQRGPKRPKEAQQRPRRWGEVQNTQNMSPRKSPFVCEHGYFTRVASGAPLACEKRATSAKAQFKFAGARLNRKGSKMGHARPVTHHKNVCQQWALSLRALAAHLHFGWSPRPVIVRVWPTLTCQHTRAAHAHFAAVRPARVPTHKNCVRHRARARPTHRNFGIVLVVRRARPILIHCGKQRRRRTASGGRGPTVLHLDRFARLTCVPSAMDARTRTAL